MTNRIYTFLGLVKKAGKLLSGEDVCERAIISKKAALVIIAEDAADNTKKRFTDMCIYRQIDTRIFGSKELLGKHIGKEKRAVIVIQGNGFAKRVIELINDSIAENCSNEENGGARNGKG